MSGWRKKQIANSIEKEIIMGAKISPLKLVSQVLTKTQESFSVTRCTNGFIVEQSGRANDEWRTVKIVCTDVDNLNEVITDILGMDLEN
jgi:hypothetical protein